MKCDENLVKRAMTGDEKAFEALYMQIHGDMYRFAYYMLGNKEDVVDAVSDAVIDIYKYIGSLRSYKTFSSWCLKILWTKCKQKRKEYVDRSEEITLEESAEISTSGNVEDNYIENVYLKEQLMSLNEDERTIVLLSALYGYNSKEIGKIMHLNNSTVRSKQKRALEKLRERIEAYGR